VECTFKEILNYAGLSWEDVRPKHGEHTE